MNFTAILASMLALVPVEKQADADARKRYITIAEAIDDASHGDSRKAKMLITVAFHESAFRRDVHNGTARGDGGRAWCLGQVHPQYWGARGPELVGTDEASTRRCVDTVSRALDKSLGKCGSVQGAFSLYGTGTTCKANGEFVQSGMRTYRRL